MAIIIRLDRIMADRKISGKQLAEILQTTPIKISKIKRGNIKAIKISTINQLCEALSCQPGDILEYMSDEDAERMGLTIADSKV